MVLDGALTSPNLGFLASELKMWALFSLQPGGLTAVCSMKGTMMSSMIGMPKRGIPPVPYWALLQTFIGRW